MTTVMEGVIGVAMTMGTSVAIMIAMAMGIGEDISNPMATGTGISNRMDTITGIGNPIPMHNQSTSHRQCTMGQCNRLVSVCFFRLILVGRYPMKRTIGSRSVHIPQQCALA